MKTRILAFLLLLTIMLPVFGTTLAFAEESSAAPAWTANGATVTEGEDGYYNVSNVQYGTGAYTTEKVQLEGLIIDMKISEMSASTAAGVIFSGNPAPSYDNSTVAMTLWYDPFAIGQSRFHVGANHDYNGATYVYKDSQGATGQGFGLDKTMVLNPVASGDIRIEITSENDIAYKVKFTIMQDHLLWGDNINYADEAGGGHSVTFYMAKAQFADALDSEGKLYVAAAGLAGPSIGIKVTESDVAPTPTPDPEPEPEPTPDPEPATPTIIGTPDSDWSASYNGVSQNSFAENGYTKVSNLVGWGTRSHYNRLVKFDGLELSFRAATSFKDCVGIVLTNAPGSYFTEPNTVAITYWNDPYGGGQARLAFTTNHNYESDPLVHVAPDLSSAKGFGADKSMVSNAAEVVGYTIKFESFNEEFYSVKITMTDSGLWEINANYNAEDKSCTVYLPKAALANILNENGELYITAAGFPDGANPAPAVEVKIVDDSYRAYISGEGLANAIAKITAYETAAGAIVDAATYDAAMAARAEAVACAGDLRARELAELTLWLARVDAELAANEEVVAIVKKAVTDKIDAATTAYYALIGDPTTLNNESLAVALALANDAKAEYENRASMLSDEAKAEIAEGIALLNYGHDYCIVLLWVTDYERKLDALDATSPSIVEALVEVKSYRERYESSTACAKMTTVITEEHKAAFEAQIAACDAEVVNIETVVLPELKESYVKAMEEKLAADLTIKPNLDDAKVAYAEIATYVSITEADGELFDRYVAGYATIKAACEAFVRAQIADVAALLENEYTVLDEFKSVRTRFKSIKIDYLMEENADIVSELAALEVNIAKNVFYYVNATDIPLVEWNERGLEMESKVEFPARLNYNKALNLKSGAEIVIELTSAAYYNDNTSANNLCFNFLAEPDSYKSMSDGISIIVWLYPTESNVQIMNNTDVPLASSTIATPIDGGTITISVKYEEYYSFVEDATYWAYVIKVNEAEIVLTAETLTSQGHEVPDEVYFSMGSFADKKDTPNILTLVSVNGVEFGKRASEQPECTEHVDANTDGKCDNCGADVEVEQPGGDDPADPDPKPDDDDKDDEKPEEELSFIQKLARFFRGIVDAIKNFFGRLFGKKA